MQLLSSEQRLFWTRRVLQFQIILSVSLFLFAFFALTTTMTTPFLEDVRRAFAEGAGQAVYNPQALGAISTPLLLSSVVSVVVLTALRRKTQPWATAAYFMLTIHVFGTIALGGAAIFSVIALLLLARTDIATELGLFKKR